MLNVRKQAYICGRKRLEEKEREREREWDETKRDERARGEDAMPMVHQKLMPTASV